MYFNEKLSHKVHTEQSCKANRKTKYFCGEIWWKQSSELNSPIPVHFSLLIPKMSTFTLAIFCLTTSNLPWFIDLTFQVPMQYCSLQHQTLPLLPVTSTTGCCFCFGSISSFFLELFLHWSPVAYWAPTDWGVQLSVSYHFTFSHCSLGSEGKNTEVVCIPFFGGPHFVRTLHHEFICQSWVASWLIVSLS